jgi:hypothetical protein
MSRAVILQFLYPLVGYHFRSLRHVSTHVLLPGSYIRGEWGNLLFTSLLLPPPPPLLQSLRSFALLFIPRAQIIDAREAPSAETQDDQGDERRDELGAFCLYAEGTKTRESSEMKSAISDLNTTEGR